MKIFYKQASLGIAFLFIFLGLLIGIAMGQTENWEKYKGLTAAIMGEDS